MIHRIFAFFLALFSISVLADEKPPNIVYIMSDELAYFELGHMENPYIKTPNIDKMVEEGLRFTNAYAAAPVCAPLRGSLMTGKHQGHCSVRANDGGTPLTADDVTIATVLKKQKEYATGGFGKWGAGGRDSTGVPEKHGFDEFVGYYDQVHAHSFYPPYIVRNSEEVVLPGNEGGRSGETYSHYKIMEEGLQFIRDNKDKPFFAYFPITPPHGMFDIPADDPAWDLYKDEAWIKDESISQDIKNYAAMVTMIDRDLADITNLLKELGLEKNTIVFFTGDNGGQEGRLRTKDRPEGFFRPNVNPKTDVHFRGGKGNLYEGGLKIPFIVRWPGKIEAGRTSDLLFSQVDIFRTLADLTGTKAPDDVDGMSILPEILGDTENQPKHEMLYWEFGNQTAVRYGKWKAIENQRHDPKKARWSLYDLVKDVSETTDVAAQNEDVLKKMIAYAESQHEECVSGTYSDPKRTKHERDRWAKWGTTRVEQPKVKGKVHRIEDKNLIPWDETSVVKFSSENRGNDRLAEYVVDGRWMTTWHSQFTPTKAEPPHELVIDLGKPRKISGFRYLARQDGGWNGSFADTEFYVSDSAEKFPEKPVIGVEFTKKKTAQAADLEEPATGRYVKVVVKSDVTGNGWASAGEIGVIEEPAGEQGPKGLAGKSGVNLLALQTWKGDTGEWAMASEVVASNTEKKWESVKNGDDGPIFYNGKKEGKTANLTSKFEFGDVEAVIEFLIPAKSNSGIYFQERYEVQILDSHHKGKDNNVHDCGAIYERGDDSKPKGEKGYEGTVPTTNAAKPPGEWQKFEIKFRAPRFDENGRKTENARFVSVKLNGIEIHKNVEVTGPTRGGKAGPEAAEAPINIQGNHGPVAFRKIEIKPITIK
ncbi:MAG: sulfatase-like hydrolase/transferase [Verrucomicrobiales bacterium]|nr:sulfatase-like hydrolase/transferase [Verrucomicrobiales bacterium]